MTGTDNGMNPLHFGSYPVHPNPCRNLDLNPDHLFEIRRICGGMLSLILSTYLSSLILYS